jgi:hypothetical protein
MEHYEKLIQVIERLDDTVEKSELSPIMLDFSSEDAQQRGCSLTASQ